MWQDYSTDTYPRTASDPGIGGVTVRLVPVGGGTTLTTTTAADGTYQFTGAVSGASYYVQVDTTTLPTGITWTQAYDPDGALPGDNRTNNLPTLTAGSVYGPYDFGYTQPRNGSIGNDVYYDFDRDGTRDVGETGIQNVNVNLYRDVDGDGVLDVAVDALVASTVTDSNGNYTFASLADARYFVQVDQADADFPTTVQTANTNPQSYTVSSGSTTTDVDFGYFGSGTISGTVWKDMNADRSQAGADETGIANIAVSLYVDVDGAGPGGYVLLTTTSTDSSGAYNFANLPYDDYQVVVASNDDDLPTTATGAKYTLTTIDRNDTFTATLSAGSPNFAADYGFVGRGSIGDFVFWDNNSNGQQDFGEEGIGGVTVKLYLDANGDNVIDDINAPVASTTTSVGGVNQNPVGIYQFVDVAPTTGVQRYIVKVTPLASMSTQTADPDRDGEGPNSPYSTPGNPLYDPNFPTFDNMDSGIVMGYSNYTGADFGYKPTGVIGDTVWLDINRNGSQDPGESGIAGVTVTAVNGGTTKTTTTDPDGKYSFANLADGTWTVSVNPATLPASIPGLTPSYDYDGLTTLDTANVTLSGGSTNLLVDFGYMLPAGNYTLSGTVVRNDQGMSGKADVPASEIGVSGQTVSLFNSSGVFLGSTLTDSTGAYTFTNLPAALNYQVVLATGTRTVEWAQYNTPSPTAPATSITAYAESIKQSGITISSSNITGVDFAFSPTGQIDWGDLPNGYGMTTSNQGGASHVRPSGGTTVYLGSVAPDTEVNGIPNANATGDDLTGSDDEDGVRPMGIWSWSQANGGKLQVTVTAPLGQTVYLLGWMDFNNDGDFGDTGEFAVNQSIVGTGTYTVNLNIPAGMANTMFARFRVMADLPPVPALAYTGQVTNGEVEDYRFDRTAIGDRVWLDGNGNKTQDAGEVGVRGVTVTLKDSGGNVIATQMTSNGSQDVDGDGTIDPVGFYRFSNLPPATYTVSIAAPTGTYVTYDEVDDAASGYDGSAQITLAAGEQHLTADFGLQAPFTLVMDDPSTVGVIDVIVVDGQPAGFVTVWGPSTNSDLSRRDGEIYFTGVVGTFAMNQTTAQSAPLVGTASEPEIRISSVDRSGATSGGTLNIWATDGCFTVPTAASYTLNSPFGGVAGTTVQMAEAVDLTNDPFAAAAGPSSTLTADATTLSTTYGPGAYSATNTAGFTVSDPAAWMSLTKKITITHSSAYRQTSISAGGVVRKKVTKGPVVSPPAPALQAPSLFSLTRLATGVSDDSVLAGPVSLKRPVFA